MIIEDENRLKTWISHLVEDISDAEPDALAKYVIALVKKPIQDSDLEELCMEKLSVFLQSHTDSFVSQLFDALKTGKYLIQQNVVKAKEQEKFDEEMVEEKEGEHEDLWHEDDIIATEAEELVLTEPESEHEREPEPSVVELKKEEPIQNKEQIKKKASNRSEQSSRSSKEDSRNAPRRGAPAGLTSSPSSAPSIKASETKTSSTTTTKEQLPSSTTSHQPTGRPFRKRISPPPRSSSGERRGGERRVSPMMLRRRPAPIGGGGVGGGATLRVPPRHYREVRRVRSKSRERSRSPVLLHASRKEKQRSLIAPDVDVRSLRRHRCRDFHEKGFCMRGDSCPYDHGPDPVVVEDSALEKIVRASTGSVFDPSGTYGVNPPPPGVEASGTGGKTLGGGSISEGYNPEAPALTTPASMTGIDFSVPPPPIPHQLRTATAALNSAHQILYPPGTIPPQIPAASAPTASLLPPLPPSFSTTGALNPIDNSGLIQIRTIGGGGGITGQECSTAVTSSLAALPAQTTSTIFGGSQTIAGGGGIFTGGHAQQQLTGGGGAFGAGGGAGALLRGVRFKPYGLGLNRGVGGGGALTSRSLLVKKIPLESNKIALLDQHFCRFGQLTNIQVQYEGKPDTALITFKTRREAIAAYKSVEPILNNRFIKVFWQTDPIATSNGDEIFSSTENVPVPTGPYTTAIRGAADVAPTIPLSTRPILRGFSRIFKKTFKKPPTLPKEEIHFNLSGEKGGDFTVDEEAVKSAPTVPLTSSISTDAAPHPLSTVVKRKSDHDTLNRLVELQHMKAELYAKLVDQQRTILGKLKGTEDKEQRKRLMALLKKTEVASKATKQELEQLSTKIRSVQQREKHPRMSSTMVFSNENVMMNPTAENGSGASSAKTLSPIKSPSKKLLKLCRVVYVLNCPQEQNEKLIVHMEQFGDLFDYDINTEPRVFTFKDPVSAQKAVTEAKASFTNADITVEWAPMSKCSSIEQAVIPDGERKPSEQVTPKDLLASLDYEEEEEVEGERGEEEEEEEEEERGGSAGEKDVDEEGV